MYANITKELVVIRSQNIQIFVRQLQTTSWMINHRSCYLEESKNITLVLHTCLVEQSVDSSKVHTGEELRPTEAGYTGEEVKES
jgi:hypothetical protein